MDNAQKHFGCMLCTFWTITDPKTIMTGPKCVWTSPKCVWALPDTFWTGKWEVREKQKQAVQDACNKDPMLI